MPVIPVNIAIPQSTCGKWLRSTDASGRAIDPAFLTATNSELSSMRSRT